MKYVYLAGPIEGAGDPQSWRERTGMMLRTSGIGAVDPYHKVVSDNPSHRAHTDRSITDRDHYHASRCDMLLVNFLGCEQVSIGTVMEIAWAYNNHIPIVIVTRWKEGSRHHHDHPMIRGCASFIVDTISEALQMIMITLGDYAEHQGE